MARVEGDNAVGLGCQKPHFNTWLLNAVGVRLHLGGRNVQMFRGG